MNDPLPSPTRRRLLGLLASLPVVGGAAPAVAAPSFGIASAWAETPFPDGATMLVGGPEHGTTDQWARLLQSNLGSGLSPGLALRLATVGGPDGVTAANEFGARITPDGRTVLLAPGAAVLDWLVGDGRAKFDVGQWLPVMACVAPAVVVGRPAAFVAGGTVRLAGAHPTGHSLPAVLGIDLLGARVQLVPDLADESAVSVAFARHAVDAVLLRGYKVPSQAATLAAAGAVPIFSLGARNEAGALVRPAAFPTIPTLPELYARRHGSVLAGPMRDAWDAAAAASQLVFTLVLPQLTPPAVVALWRRAGTETVGALSVQSAALALAVQPLGGPMATASTAPLAANAAGLQTLREWLARRFNWHPS